MLNSNFFVVDFETGGLDPRKHDPVQVAVQVLDKDTLKTIGSFSTYIKPDPSRVSEDALKINNLSLEFLSDAPSKDQALFDLVSFLKPFGRGVFVAHNAKFDYDFLSHWVESCDVQDVKLHKIIDHRLICTVQLAFEKYLLKGGDVDNVKLTTLTEFLKINHNAHEASSDVDATAEVFRRCMKSSVVTKFIRGFKSALRTKEIKALFHSLEKHY